VLRSPYPTDEDVVKRIIAAVQRKSPWYAPTPVRQG
jgi:hypothetical protein